MLDVYERFFSTSTELFLVTDGQGRIVRVNPRWESVLGYRPEELHGQTLFCYAHPEDVARNFAMRERLQREGTCRDFENRGIHKDGRVVWLRWFGNIDPETGYFYGTAKDVTTEKTAAEKLDRIATDAFDAMEFERIISRIAPLAIYRVDLQGNLTYANSYWEELAGLPFSAARGLGWIEAIHPDDRTHLEVLRQRRIRGQSDGQPIEFRFRHPDGRVVWMVVTSAPVHSHDGRHVGSIGAGLDITAIKENEIRLANLNQQLNLLLEAGGHGTWTWDTAGGPCLVDARWCAMFGLDPIASATPEFIETMVHPEDRAATYGSLAACVSGEAPKHEAVVRMLHQRTGKWVWILATGKVTDRDATGKALRVAGFAVDITAEKEREAELARHRRLVDSFLSHSPSAIHVKDLQGAVLLANDNYRRLSPRLAQSPDPLAVAAYGQERKSEETDRIDGVMRTYFSSTFPLYDETGAIYGTAGVKTDITDLVRERERASLLEKLIESSRDGFGYCDADGRPLYLNRFLTEELGWSLAKDDLLDYVSERTRQLFEDEVLPALLGRQLQWEGEVEYLNARTGEVVPIWQRTFFSPGADGKPRYLAFFATDLRTKKKAEAAILHSSKMASLGQMAAGVAHEVNNPITIIHGTASLLKRAASGESIDAAKLSSGLERIEKTALRISRIVRGLRTFSRSGENDRPSLASLREIVEETLDLCRERFRYHAIDLRVAPIPEVSLRCRPTQISQVILNLLNNCFDAVSAHPDRWIELEATVGPDRVEIAVTDSGRGIPEDVRPRLMEPFFTTKAPGEGTGLGLPISRGIVEEHGGRLSYDPTAPHTRFRVELPLDAARETSERPPCALTERNDSV